MKNLILTLLLAVLASSTTTAMEIDTLWYRTMGAGAQDVDFTPDDKYVIAWANGIEFWEVQEGVKEFFIPSETTGDYNYNEQYLVFAQDSTPKLLNWQTREVIEGFEKENLKIDRILTAKSKNEFMAKNISDDKKLYFWDIDSKRKVDSFDIIDKYQGIYEWHRSVLDYGYIGNKDEYFYIKYSDYNSRRILVPPGERRTNDFYHIYDRETKELKDSIFRFQSTVNDNGIYVDKLVVMNDRSKLAWNNKGGEINFYEYNGNGLLLFDNLVFSSSEYTQVNDIELSVKTNTFGITHGQNLKIYNLITKEILHEYFLGSWQNLSFSNNDELLTTNIGSWLVLFPSHITTTSIDNEDDDIISLNFNPNPASNSIQIEFQTKLSFTFKLSIVDLIGNEIAIIEEGQINSLNYQTEFNVSNLSTGSYFIRLEIDDEVITKQFIKE